MGVWEGLFQRPTREDSRSQRQGRLRADFQGNLGIGLDGFCCRYLHVDYTALRERTLAGGSDAEILDWCYETARPVNETEAYICGLGERTDLLTAFDFYDADEGRGG
jgi:hypothetical protein